MSTITTNDLSHDEATTTEHARLDYLALFSTASAAMEFETQTLSIGREFLPADALAVLDGGEADAEYYAWLADQVEQVEHDQPNVPGGPKIHDFGLGRRRK